MTLRFLSAGISAFFLLQIFFVSFASGRSLSESAFLEQVSAEVGAATRTRSGLVILRDLTTRREWVWDAAALSEQKFLPGSTIKLVSAELALKKGAAPAYFCSGHDRMGGKRMQCWDYRGHGALDFPRALALSCNLYFSRLGVSLGATALINAFQEAGFSGSLALVKKTWNAPRTARLAIGDEPMFRVTPREVMRYWNALLARLGDPAMAPMVQGLQRAVQEGTGRKAATPVFTILGKTGTSDAQNSSYKTDGWFLSAYPVRYPRWSLLVFLKQAHGFDESAALAGKIWALGVKTGFWNE